MRRAPASSTICRSRSPTASTTGTARGRGPGPSRTLRSRTLTVHRASNPRVRFATLDRIRARFVLRKVSVTFDFLNRPGQAARAVFVRIVARGVSGRALRLRSIYQNEERPLAQKWGRPSRGARTAPSRLVCPGGGGSSRSWSKQVSSIADRTVDVFREYMTFPISHASRGLAEIAQLQLLPEKLLCVCFIEGSAFLLAHRHRAGVSPVIRLNTVEKCACVQKPMVSATSASDVSVPDSSDFACSMRLCRRYLRGRYPVAARNCAAKCIRDRPATPARSDKLRQRSKCALT